MAGKFFYTFQKSITEKAAKAAILGGDGGVGVGGEYRQSHSVCKAAFKNEVGTILKILNVCSGYLLVKGSNAHSFIYQKYINANATQYSHIFNNYSFCPRTPKKNPTYTNGQAGSAENLGQATPHADICQPTRNRVTCGPLCSQGSPHKCSMSSGTTHCLTSLRGTPRKLCVGISPLGLVRALWPAQNVVHTVVCNKRRNQDHNKSKKTLEIVLG